MVSQLSQPKHQPGFKGDFCTFQLVRLDGQTRLDCFFQQGIKTIMWFQKTLLYTSFIEHFYGVIKGGMSHNSLFLQKSSMDILSDFSFCVSQKIRI